ncbi:hypothetical protein Taro_026292, partial [Colocasia esculenta]|nr:hypothetical protein [Colocasia esculenta]
LHRRRSSTVASGTPPPELHLIAADTILKAVGAGGNVLLPVDTAGWALELILILEQVPPIRDPTIEAHQVERVERDDDEDEDPRI